MTTRPLSVLSKTLSSKLRKKLIDLAQGDGQTNIFSSQMMVLNGQSAEIVSFVSLPFVVAIQNDGQGGFRPTVRVIEDGFRIRLRPVVNKKGGPIRLNGTVEWNRVTDVKTASFQLGTNQAVMTFQVPELTEQRFNIADEVAAGQSLLISPLKPDDEKKRLYILIQPRYLTP